MQDKTTQDNMQDETAEDDTRHDKTTQGNARQHAKLHSIRQHKTAQATTEQDKARELDIDGEQASNESECSVSLSSNGDTVAIGATASSGYV